MNHASFYVTTPIYYVNDKPHIGHAYTTVLADVLARYHRLLGVPTHFLTGTDEHGQKVQQAADRNGISPQEQCDRTVVRFQDLWTKLEITHDDFIRTTEDRHRAVVCAILQDLYDRGEIYAAEYEGWYCVGCERFFTERDLADGACPECSRTVDRLVERNYFFRMSKYQDWLISHIHEHPEFIQPDHRRAETLGFLRKPLGDLCISRPKSRLAWGIELPFDRDYVTYVWFDALINYISAVGYGAAPGRFAEWWPASVHLIGKDILTTHTVYWPTMLKAIGIDMPRSVFAHGWWLTGAQKMSKSLGNVVNPMDLAELYGADSFRYFLMAEMSLGQDANFTEELFVTRYNAELANDLGNMVSRVVKMITRHADGRVPGRVPVTEAEEALRDACLGATGHMVSCIDSMQLDRGIAEVMQAVREGNRYFEQNAPWTLAKTGDTAGLNRVLYSAAECLRIVSGLLYPVMPGRMTELRRALGLQDSELEPRVERLSAWHGLEPGRAVVDPGTLFPRIDRDKVAAATAALGGKPEAEPAEAEASDEGLIDIETFGKVQLRTARVLAAEPVEGASKLLKLQISLGSEQRQIVAGLARHYRPDDLVGRTIVVVANLKPARLRGVESQGMLLAARDGKDLRILTVDSDVPGGLVIS
jgi:methionyl-tRNA synthetase